MDPNKQHGRIDYYSLRPGDVAHPETTMALVNYFSDHRDALAQLEDAFEREGLGAVYSSWISEGDNFPITVEQVKDVLGEDRLREIAQRAGLDEETVQIQLTDVLPYIIDRLSPNGRVPKGGLEPNLLKFKKALDTGIFQRR